MKNKRELESKNPLEGCKIQVSKDGPYLVSGGVPLLKQTIICDSEGTSFEWRVDTKYSLQEKCSLCRCGQSKKKPFCDGTHVKVSFDGTETAGQEEYLNEAVEIDGLAAKLTDIEILCASARFCHRAGGIWSLIPRSAELEAKRIAIEEACDCPSGRLVVWDKKSKKTIELDFEKSVVLIEDPWVGVIGPIWVRGGIPVESVEGEAYRVRNRVTLCRCGKSSNKPFCDSSHYPEQHEHGKDE